MTENLEAKNSPLDYIDPAWDYATIFKMLVEYQHQVGKAISTISNQETATPHSHANLAMQLEYLASSLQVIQQELR